MKIKMGTALLTVGFGMIGFQAHADSLSELESACRTGDFAACSQYNALVVARSSGQMTVLSQGYDPFAIVPATHVERAPVLPAPANGAGDLAVQKSSATTENPAASRAQQ